MNIVDRLCRKWLSRRGYQVNALITHQVIPDAIPSPSDYSTPEDFHRYLRPWNLQDFRTRLTPEILENTMLPGLKLYFLQAFALRAARQAGDFFEAGVYNGGSARLLLDVLRSQGAPNKLWLLDTFSGYSVPSRNHDGSLPSEGDCRGQPKAYVEQLLNDGASQIHIVEGSIPDTLAQVTTQHIAFAHIDVNLYEPTLAATDFCIERMVPGGVILFDDYGWPATYGARMAIEESCRRFSQVVISIPESTQAFLVKS